MKRDPFHVVDLRLFLSLFLLHFCFVFTSDTFTKRYDEAFTGSILLVVHKTPFADDKIERGEMEGYVKRKIQPVSD